MATVMREYTAIAAPTKIGINNATCTFFCAPKSPAHSGLVSSLFVTAIVCVSGSNVVRFGATAQILVGTTLTN